MKINARCITPLLFFVLDICMYIGMFDSVSNIMETEQNWTVAVSALPIGEIYVRIKGCVEMAGIFLETSTGDGSSINNNALCLFVSSLHVSIG